MAEEKSLGQFLEDFLANFMRSPQGTFAPIDVNQVVTDAGYDPADLAGLDVNQIYQNACDQPGVPSYYKESYSPQPTAQHVVQQVQQVQQVQVTQIIDNSIDNSTSVDNSVDFEGDIDTGGGDFDFDQNNATATGGSVAAGDDAVGATGQGSAATGQGDAAASGGVNLDASTNFDLQFGRGEGGQPTILANENAPLLAERFTPEGGLSGLRPDINVNTGAGNQTNVDGPVTGSQIGDFGAGAQNNAGATFDNSPVASGGDATNFQDNTADHGSGLGIAGGDITGSNDDNSQHADTHGDYSPIQQEQGAGDQHVEEQEEDAPIPV